MQDIFYVFTSHNVSYVNQALFFKGGHKTRLHFNLARLCSPLLCPL